MNRKNYLTQYKGFHYFFFYYYHPCKVAGEGQDLFEFF